MENPLTIADKEKYWFPKAFWIPTRYALSLKPFIFAGTKMKYVAFKMFAIHSLKTHADQAACVCASCLGVRTIIPPGLSLRWQASMVQNQQLPSAETHIYQGILGWEPC